MQCGFGMSVHYRRMFDPDCSAKVRSFFYFRNILQEIFIASGLILS
jgi:hypothetical protein